MTLQNINEETYTVHVIEKMRVTYGHIYNVHKYLIYTIDDNGIVRVFENTDSIPHKKFNSSDIYARIQIGKVYTLRTVGFRLPVFSMYKNIIGVELRDTWE